MDVLSEKIKRILVEKNLTPSYFADEIGVQRSSISHILSGRNKPSFELIQKIIRRFPDLGINWILDEDISASIQVAKESPAIETKSISGKSMVQLPSTTLPNPSQERPVSATNEKKIEKILIFYTDKTFMEYKPGEL